MQAQYRGALALLFVLAGSIAASAQNKSFGIFSGSPKVSFDIDGRNVRLLEPLSFTDSEGITWLVPRNFVSDGASIPKIFWSFIGGPFAGRHRDAAIVHDYFCERRTYDWRRVHRTFYKAMRARGVSQSRAWIMYKAVMTFGPRWEARKPIPECQPGPHFRPDQCVLNQAPPEIVYPAITAEAKRQFISELVAEGFEAEASELSSILENSN